MSQTPFPPHKYSIPAHVDLLEQMGTSPDALTINRTLAPLTTRVMDTLRKRGDFVFVSPGILGDGRDCTKLGVDFYASTAGARAVADQMPQCEVIDDKGNRVMPSAKPATPQPARKPRLEQP